ncbi:hypothetical protein B0H14DRAFT_3048722 [Mycena olivaceomarginata]|nr:hypothetical protein B0H14DRAFT_3048722 [Mycena olivaceomarginata]
MDKLPNELLDRICSFLGKHELWEVVQLSTRFRRLAMLPYLSRFGISQATVQSGTLALSDSFFLILVVARINPIQRLVCFQDVAVSGSLLRYRKLTSILAVTAPIPDIVIYNRYYMLQRTRKETAYMLARIPSSATSTLVVVKGSSTYLSRPRSVPPIRWKLLIRTLGLVQPLPTGEDSHPHPRHPHALRVLGVRSRQSSCPYKLGVPPPHKAALVARGTHPRGHRSARLRRLDAIQSLPEKQLTLVTLTDKRWPTLVLRPVPGLTASMYSSLLASLDLGTHLEHLIVEPHTNLDHAELMAFLKRHRHLSTVLLEPASIRPSSLAPMPVAMVPTAENQVKRISLLFAAAPKHIPGLRGTTFDLSAYRAALSAIAALPRPAAPRTARPHRAQPRLPPHRRIPSLVLPPLPLFFPLSVRSRLGPCPLPRTPPHAHAHPLPRAPPPRLPAALPCLRPRAPTFLRWLGLFPALQRVSFAFGSVEKIPAGERAGLAAGICEACGGRVRAGDVAFNVADD